MGYLFYNNWYYSASVFPTMEDHIDPVNNAYFTGLHTEIENIENAIGLNPTGAYPTIADRLAAIPPFTDRGDPSAADFSIGSFTTDGSPHILDLSAIVPPGAKVVIFNFTIADDAANKSIYFWKYGNTNQLNISRFTTILANNYEYGIGICPISADSKLGYITDATTFTALTMTIIGWW